MSIWKSPVFYFGIILFVAVTAALAAPYLVPWNSYRAQLESYGEKLTGRDVAIAGDIAVKLFPWPMLEAKHVSIGNPEGFSEGAFIQADVIRVRLSLAGLVNGGLDVESIEAGSPQFNLQRNASGNVNWVFAPKEKVVGQGLLQRVKLDQISLSNGLVSFDDLRNGHSTLFSGLDATLSAQSILGPWRMKGDVKWQNLPLVLTVTSNEKKADEPLKFTVKMAPVDVALPQLAVEGSWDGASFNGAVRIDPQDSQGVKTSAEGAFKPLALQALLEASEARMSLTKIKIAPVDRKDSGTLIEGDAVMEFGTQALARIDLKSPRVNLDTLVGVAAMQQWRDGGFLAAVNQLLALMPVKLIADYKLNVSVLTSGGQALNDVRLTGSIQKEAVRVHEFTAELPGRSVGVFDGILFPGKKAAQLGGKMRFESLDTRAFLSWLTPSWRDTLQKHWTGSRGHFEVLAGTIDWTADGLALNDVNYRFENIPGRATLAWKSGDSPSVNVDINAGQVDVDSLLPNGWSMLRDGGVAGIASALSQGAEQPAMQQRLALRASSVLLNGVTAQEVALTVLGDAKGFEIKLLDIGNVGGARLSGGGEVSDQGNGPEGTLNFHLEAPEPRGFLRLVGLEYGAGSWTEALGQTSFDATVTAVPQKSGAELKIEARGSSGALNAEIVAAVREIEKAGNANVAASGGLNSADSAALARLLGVIPSGPVGAGDVTFEFNGALDQGFVFSTRLKALDMVAELGGTADLRKAYLGVSGKFKAAAGDGRAVLQAIGVPIVAEVAQPLDLSTVVVAKDGGLSLLDIAGNAGGRRFSGQVDVSAQGRMLADLETDTLDIKEAMAMAFMPWEGAVADAGQAFADIDAPHLPGEVYIKPLQFETITGAAQREVVVAIGVEKNERRLSVTAAGEQGLQADLVLKPRGASKELSGSLRWPIDLGRSLTTVDHSPIAKGDLVVKGDFKASGSSPAAMLSALEGKGNYWLTNMVMSRITLEGLASAVLAAKTPDALTAALSQLDSAPGSFVGQRIGTVNVSNGELSFSAFSPVVEGVIAEISPQIDLTSNQLKIATRVNLDKQPDLPAVVITYAGLPWALDVRNGTSALAAKLGYALLSEEMAKLERLQQEQQALVAKEETQRAADEKRFADYQATRVELRKQAAVRRLHGAARDQQSRALAAVVDQALKVGLAGGRVELLRHARRLAVRAQR
jgi:uncharacterized protein involved in outer membrane biogenesis